jgi:hypothetical protein
MASTGYSVITTANVSLVATTAKTILGIKSGAAFGCDLYAVSLGFDGVTATDKAVLVEVCYCTWATNAPGTNSTTRTPAQMYGRVIAHGVTAASAWSAEPTALTPLEEFTISPIGGTAIQNLPLGQTYDCAVGEGFAIRLTAPTSAVNVRATMKWERC